MIQTIKLSDLKQVNAAQKTNYTNLKHIFMLCCKMPHSAPVDSGNIHWKKLIS
jgi:hypothetical protein